MPPPDRLPRTPSLWSVLAYARYATGRLTFNRVYGPFANRELAEQFKTKKETHGQGVARDYDYLVLPFVVVHTRVQTPDPAR